jgi:NADPH-dependent ferric siderophore reductase
VNRLLRVRRRELLTPRMVRITLGGDELAGFPGAGPDRRIRMFFPADGGRTRPALPRESSGGPVWAPGRPRPAIRTYTVRGFDPAAGELDVDFVLHDGPGPAVSWARHARPADEVGVSDPGGRYAPDATVDWHLLVGDESALPAIATVLAALPDGARVEVFVEVADAAERQPLPSGGGVRVHWVHRDTARHGDRLVAAVRGAALPAGRGQAWVSAEASSVFELRRHLLDERGIERRLLYATNYWRVTS